MHSPAIWTEILDRLERGADLAVATIATKDGSTPRGAGSKMLVASEGALCGSVGGGAVEAMAIQAAREVVAGGPARVLPVDMTGDLGAGADLVCGGRLDILVQRLRRDSLPVYRAIDRMLAGGGDGYLVTAIDDGARQALILPDGRVVGGELFPGMASAVLDDPPDAAGLLDHGAAVYFVEAVRARIRLILLGGGHVSRAIAEMASLVEFEVWVVEDREEYAAPSRFPWIDPDRLVVRPGFADCLAPEGVGGDVDVRCFVAILTRNHAFDYEALAQALRTRAGYIGMIGSRRKRDQIYEKLRGTGHTDAELERVHSPIGLAIGADTPAEIAVSVVAELVSVRASLRAGGTHA